VCVDANAGARAAAKQQHLEKVAVYKQKALQFWNKEVAFKRTLERNIIGYSRSEADARNRALSVQAKGRLAKQDAVAKYLRSKQVDEGGRSRKFGVGQYQALLRKEAKIENAVAQAFGRDLANMQTINQRQFMAANARGREQLGIPAAFGAPVMMPPTNRLGGALQIASSVASIYSAFASDIKLKENVKQVGVSPQGYNIYEFNYTGSDVRFRGAMAQDVVKKNPMAVGIDQNYLTVDYSKIDVAMEVV
tara:strand:- start:9076 stop:9822 length:747 start_codon:yes stop_codon:yes gene_type:complete